MDETRVWKYYRERCRWTDDEAEIAETMVFIKREMPEYPEEKLYALAVRLWQFREKTDQPFLAAELSDTLRYILQEGLEYWGGCDVHPELMSDFLLQCDDELFEYIMVYEGAENQVRFQADYPEPWPEERLQNAVEAILEEIGA